MTALAAIQGDYVDVRFIKTRKVCQIVIEAPIEAGGAIISAFGTPNPAITIPVVIARLNAPVEVQATKAITEKPKAVPERKGGKLSREAAKLCHSGSFWKFMAETAMGAAANSDDAADILRGECGVTTRADLDHVESAGARFREIKASYDAWMMVG